MEIQPDLSLCLIPEQAGADLSSCLEALFACTDPLSLEIFVPQGACCGDLHDSPHLHFLGEPFVSNAIFVQLCWQQGRGRYLGLWHSGVMATPASLFTLGEFLDDHPDAAVVGPRFFNNQGDVLPTAFARNTFGLGTDQLMSGWDGLATMEVDWLSGAALVVNRLALEDASLPVTSLGGSWERSFCMNIQRQGWHIFFVHLARVVSRERFCEPTTFRQRLKDTWQGVASTSVGR